MEILPALLLTALTVGTITAWLWFLSKTSQQKNERDHHLRIAANLADQYPINDFDLKFHARQAGIWFNQRSILDWHRSVAVTDAISKEQLGKVVGCLIVAKFGDDMPNLSTNQGQDIFRRLTMFLHLFPPNDQEQIKKGLRWINEEVAALAENRDGLGEREITMST